MLLSLFYEKKFNMSWFLAPFRGDQWPMRYVYTCININLHFRTSLMCIKSLQSFLLLLKVFGQWWPFRLTPESFWINPRSWSTLAFWHRMPILILCISCLRPGISYFPKDSQFLLVGNSRDHIWALGLLTVRGLSLYIHLFCELGYGNTHISRGHSEISNSNEGYGVFTTLILYLYLFSFALKILVSSNISKAIYLL